MYIGVPLDMIALVFDAVLERSELMNLWQV